MKYLLIFLFGILSLSNLCAQPDKFYTADEKAIKYYKEGIKYYQGRQNDKALEEFEKAIKRDPHFFEALAMIGNIYLELRNIPKSLEYLARAIAVSPTYHPNTLYRLGILELADGRYADSKKHLEQFNATPNVNPNFMEFAKKALVNCNFAIEAMKKPVPFNPVNMGPEINTQYDEYFPAITADGQTFFITRKLPAGTVTWYVPI